MKRKYVWKICLKGLKRTLFGAMMVSCNSCIDIQECSYKLQNLIHFILSDASCNNGAFVYYMLYYDTEQSF